MERFDVFVIGGGGTGSEVAFSLARTSGLNVALAERDKLGGECNHYGCVPTKVMLRSAKIAALARDAARFGVKIPEVDLDFKAVQQRARDVIESQSGEGATPFERVGVRVLMQEARLLGERRVELADGTQIEADRVVLTTGTEADVPPIPGLADGPFWTNREAIWNPGTPPGSLAVIGTGAIGTEFAQIYARFGSRVTALEVLPHFLPQEDEEAAASLIPALERDGIALLPGRGDRARRSRRIPVDHHPSREGPRPRGRAVGRDGTATGVRPARPRCGRRRAGRRREPGAQRHASDHEPRCLGRRRRHR